MEHVLCLSIMAMCLNKDLYILSRQDVPCGTREMHIMVQIFFKQRNNLNSKYFPEQTFECYRLLYDSWGRWPGQLIENNIRVQHYTKAQMVAAVTMTVSTFMFHDENHLHSIGVLVRGYAWLQIWELSTVTVFTSKVIIILIQTSGVSGALK